MELGRLYEELLRAAERLEVPVRAEPFDPGLAEGRRPRRGLCVVRGRPLILVDASAPLPDRVAMLAGALGELDTESLYLPPVVRATIASYRPLSAADADEGEERTALPLRRTKPWR